MIKDKLIAEKINNLMLGYAKDLNQSIALVESNCSEDEFEDYKKTVGKIMGEMLVEIMNPLYSLHPDIKPKELS